MAQQRNLKRDVLAVGLFALVAFMGLSLATYNRADPPASLVYPAPTQTANACGWLGAWAAHLTLAALGLGAYYFLLSAVVLDFLLLRRKPIGEPTLRVMGWALSLVAFATLAALAWPADAPGPVVGPGGYVGAAGRGFLEAHFAKAGAYIVAASTLFGGLLLCTDYVLVRISLWLVGAPAKRLVYAGRLAVSRSSTKSRRKPAAHAGNGHDVNSTTNLAIRFPASGGKKAALKSPHDDLRAPLDDDAEFDEEDMAVTADAAVAADSDAAPDDAGDDVELRIRPPVQKKLEDERVRQQLDAASVPGEAINYEMPSLDLLLDADDFPFEAHEKHVRTTAKLLERTFANFGFAIRVVEIQTGPVIAQYEIELEKGLRLAKITGLADDIAIALRVPSVRIVAPIPGKNTVGIEVPNAERQLVRLREVIEEGAARAQKMKIPIFLGKDVSGHSMVIDLATLPHLLIAGRTGTGKSVCLNSIILSMLMTRRPDEVRMLLVDPKMVELSPYQRLPHLMHPVVTDMRKAEAILGWAVEKMEERYALLARAGVRHISNYNALGEEELVERLQPETDEDRAAIPRQLPFIVIVADEMADLMMTSGKEVEQHIIRLAQKSRAVGIHLILATQKPTVDVITGLIKSNLPARISFQVASRTDSRVVLDEMGADKLLGNGDMLFLWPGTSHLHRGQGTFVCDEEIAGVVGSVSNYAPQFVKELVQLKPKDVEGGPAGGFKRRDDLYEQAVDVVVREGRGSVSLLQRTLGIGYGRAARLIDFMAEDSIVGEYNGAQAREVLISLGQWEAMREQAQQQEPPRSRRKPSLPSPIRLDRPAKLTHDDDPEDEDDDADEFSDEDDESVIDEDDGNDADDDSLDDDDHRAPATIPRRRRIRSA
jgi:S-DNA-T family DNA segregation ATPase FtsK/SpoIIIE